MVDVSGVPNLGIPGLSGFSGGAPNNGGYFADPGAGLNNAYASQASNQRFFGQQAATPSTVPQSQLYGPQGFGGATAQAAATGAAYGRNTGGFNAGKQVAPIPGSGQKAGGGSVFDTGATPVTKARLMPLTSSTVLALMPTLTDLVCRRGTRRRS
jgi:hypothetical protein